MTRVIQPVINWTWFYTDTKEDAIAWFEELTGVAPKYDWIIMDPVVRDQPGLHDHMYSFRLKVNRV